MGRYKKSGKNKKSSPSPVPGLRMNPSFIRQKNFFIFAIAVFAFFLYGNTLKHEYAFDDSVVITGNQYTKMGLQGIPLLLQKDMFEGIYNKALELSGGRYRPLSLVTFAIEYAFFGENPFISHAFNCILYALTGIFLFLTLLKIFQNRLLVSALGTILFISHPTHTEVVANIKSRDEILAFLFLLGSVYFLFSFIERKKMFLMLLGQLFFFLSLLSKETGITFLVLFPMILYCLKEKTIPQSLYLSIPAWVTGIAYILIRTYLVGIPGDRDNPDIMENPFVHATLSERVGTTGFILVKYFLLLVFPHPLSSDYSFNEIPLIRVFHPQSLLSLAALGGLTFFSIKHILKKNILALCFFLFLLPLIPVSNLFVNIGAPMAERFLYIPSLGFCLGAAVILVKLLKMNDAFSLLVKKPLFWLLLIPLLGAFSWKTIHRNRDWKDNETLFAKDVNAVPGSAKIHYYYGNTLLTEILKSESETLTPEQAQTMNRIKYHTLQAVRINKDFHHAHYNLGLVYEKLNMPDSALYHFHRVLSIQPHHLLTQSAIGNVYGKHKKNYDKAIGYLEIAVQHDPKDKRAWENLGIAYGEKNNFKKAIEALEQSLKLDPGNAKTYNNMAVTFYKMGNLKMAETYRQKFLQLSGQTLP